MVKQSQGTKVKEPKVAVEDVEVEESVDSSSNYNGAKIIWGLLFIVVGLLILLGNIGVLNIDLWQLWKLWPLLIIMAGLSILALRGWLAVTISVILTVAVLGLATAVLTGAIETGNETTNESFNIVQVDQAVRKANVEIGTGAGSLNVSSHNGEDVVRGSLESDVFKLKQETSTRDGVQNVNLSIDGSSKWWRGNLHNILTVQLNENLPTSLTVNAGASDIKLDLSNIIAEAVEVDSGASSIWLKLGNKQSVSVVNIDTGVSSVDLLVPKNTGTKIEIDGGLNSKDIPSDFVEISKNIYQSPNYDQSDRKINIVLDMGVSRMSLKTY